MMRKPPKQSQDNLNKNVQKHIPQSDVGLTSQGDDDDEEDESSYSTSMVESSQNQSPSKKNANNQEAYLLYQNNLAALGL